MGKRPSPQSFQRCWTVEGGSVAARARQIRTVLAVVALLALAAALLAGLWYLDFAAFVGGAAALIVLAVALMVPRTRRSTKRAVSRDGQFASAREGHSLCGFAIPYSNFGNAAGQDRDRLSAVFTKAGWLPETLNVVLWVVHRHGNRTFALVRQEEDDPSRWTASVDGPMSDEDVNLDGLLDPVAAAERIAKTQIDLPIYNIHFLSWGVERDTSRAVLVGWAETDITAADMRSHDYPNPLWTGHLAELDPQGAAKAIGWAGSAHWRAGALYGLARMVEESGGLKVLERILRPRWSTTISHTTHTSENR